MSALGFPPSLVVGVTGHRDLVPDEVPGLREAVCTVLEQLVRDYPALQVSVLSGLAEGADQLVAEVALELDLPLVAILPFEQPEYEEDFSAEGLVTFRRLISESQVITLPLQAGFDRAGLQAQGTARERHYAELGVFISNHSQLLLALWDGKENGALGGTASVVGYHLTAVMPGLSLASEAATLLADNENDLTIHVVCSRDREHGAPAPPLVPLEHRWMTARPGFESDQSMPAEYEQMFHRLETFGQDQSRYNRSIAQEGQGLLESTTTTDIPAGVAFMDGIFASADWLAVHFQRRFASGLLMSHVLAVLMGLVFIIYSEFVEQSWLVLVFLGVFSIGVLLHLVGDSREWHRKYLDYRALAEGLRVQVYWNLAGVVKQKSTQFAYGSFLQKQDVDLAWIRHVMRSASLQRSRSHAPDPAWVDWVIGQWVGDGAEGSGQLGYYTRQFRRRSAAYRRTVMLGNLALAAGITMALCLAIFWAKMSDTSILLLLILMGVLPLMAGVRDAYTHKKADKELIKQYIFMSRVFANASRLLGKTEDLEFKRRVLRAVGYAALDEHAEWLLIHRERPLDHGGI